MKKLSSFLHSIRNSTLSTILLIGVTLFVTACNGATTTSGGSTTLPPITIPTLPPTPTPCAGTPDYLAGQALADSEPSLAEKQATTDADADASKLTAAQGITDGYNDAYSTSYQNGYHDTSLGYPAGYSAGYASGENVTGGTCAGGTSDGTNQGNSDGEAAGNSKGYSDGYTDGYSAGLNDGAVSCENAKADAADGVKANDETASGADYFVPVEPPITASFCFAYGFNANFVVDMTKADAAYTSTYNAEYAKAKAKNTLYQQGYAQGQSQGASAGTSAGQSQGYSDGKRLGYFDGYNAANPLYASCYSSSYQTAYNQSYTEYYSINYTHGYNEGYNEGFSEGSVCTDASGDAVSSSAERTRGTTSLTQLPRKIGGLGQTIESTAGILTEMLKVPPALPHLENTKEPNDPKINKASAIAMDKQYAAFGLEMQVTSEALHQINKVKTHLSVSLSQIILN